MNKLFYGDNLDIMANKVGLYSVDLIYLDPPFNSNRNYNLMYGKMTGQPVPEQVDAFCDTWTMDEEKDRIARSLPVLLRETGVEDEYIAFWDLWVTALRKVNSPLLAYLIYMVPRLCHMKKILKPTGSIYLHCDPTASHYIKVMMDGIFGHSNFRNEIIWKRTSAHSDARRGLGATHDVLLFYSMSNKFTWNRTYQAYSREYIEARYKHKDPDGRRWMDDNLSAKGLSGGGYQYEYKGVLNLWRVPLDRMEQLDKENRLYFTRNGGIRIKRYLDEMKGISIGDVWTDIHPINSQSRERLGYPTQKPIELLKRIILSSSNPGDLIFDPFCGCGTTIYAAQTLERKWIGCDIAILSIRLVRDALREKYTLAEGRDFDVDGIPRSVDSACELFKRDPFQFQHWIVERAGGFPMQKKSSDHGVDGKLFFETKDGIMEMVLSVKGGNTGPAHIRELRGVLERETAAKMAGFLCLKEPTKAMLHEAANAGHYDYLGNSYPRIQILTVRDILEEKRLFNTPTTLRSKVDSGQMVFGLDW